MNVMLLDAVRVATQRAHLELEKSDLLAPLSGFRELTKKSYLSSLLGLYAVMHAIESHLHQKRETIHIIKKYLKPCSTLLEQDIQLLCDSVVQAEFNLPKPSMLEHTIALLYIQKGAKLGAKTIYRNIMRSDKNLPCRYFEICKSQNKDWNEFCNELNEQQEIDQEKLILAVNRIYTDIKQYFASWELI